MTTIQEKIEQGEITGFQILTIAICTFLNMLDGFDILVMAFAAPAVAQEWGLPNSEIGMLLSAGLFGMAIGAFFVGPIADKVGRKPIVVLALSLITFGMLAAYWSTSSSMLAAFRLITGVGVGAMIASLNTLVSEFAPRKNRSLAVTILQTGNPVGATIGGLLSVYLIANFGWRETFLFGGLMSLAMLPVVVFILPESIDYLASNGKKESLPRINRILKKLKLGTIDTLPPAKESVAGDGFASNYTHLVRGEYRARTILISIAFFLVMFSFYYTMSWTPKLLSDAGYAMSAAISGSVLLNIGGAIGALILGFNAERFGLTRGVGLYMGATAAFMALFGLLSGSLVPAFTIALGLGFFLFGSIIGLYAVAPVIFDVQVRATGISIAIGVGRIGAVLAPLLAGVLLDSGLQPSTMFILFGLPMLGALIAQRSIKFGQVEG